MKTLVRIFRYVSGYKLMALAAFIMSLVGSALVLVAPIMTERFFDVIIPEQRKDLILGTTLTSVGLIVLRQILLMGNTILNTALEQKLVHELRQELYDKIQRMPLRFFDKRKSGDIMSRVSADVPAMESVIVQGIGQGLGGIVQAAVVLVYMLNQHVGLTLITLIPMPIVAVITWLYSKFGEPRYKRESEASARMNDQLHDSLAGIRQIKVYTVEDEKRAEFGKRSEEVLDAQMRVVRANAITWPTVSMIAESGLLAMLGAGAYWVLVGDVKIGVMLSFLAAWGYFYEPFSRIGPLSKVFAKGRASANRVFEVLDEGEEVNLKAGKVLDDLRGEVRFQSVTFGYEREERANVKNINLVAKAGQTVAFVGETGAGKSTLLNLLTGFYHPWEGKVLIDGESVETLAKDWLRQNTGYVTQDNFLFNVSVRDNLLLAKGDASDEELWEVLEAANAAGFVRAFPQRLETLTGERGSRLSGGEKQRLSIARALLKNPPILLLDEATSAVDNETERLIQEALERLRSARTSFVIAHRLSTIESADLICVMKAGEIVERGTHQELLSLKGIYAGLSQNVK